LFDEVFHECVRVADRVFVDGRAEVVNLAVRTVRRVHRSPVHDEDCVAGLVLVIVANGEEHGLYLQVAYELAVLQELDECGWREHACAGWSCGCRHGHFRVSALR
jgi:hypothetical protein